jgi:S-layer homology domain
MKKTNLHFLFLPLLLLLNIFSANAQITDISQVKDVQPTDKHFMALQSLVERYGVFSEKTFRGNDPLTREEFVVLLNSSLDRLLELAASTDEEIFPFELFTGFSANETNITSISQIKDIKATYSQYIHLQSLVERYGIDICDADKNFRPTKIVTEKEFYTWITKIFNGTANSSPSTTKAITRSEWIIVMNDALDSVNERIATLVDEKQATNKIKKQSDLIKNLPAKGKAKIVAYLKSYTPDNTCIDFTGASDDLKKAAVNGGLWNGYKMKNDDIGDIIFETNNTCKKGEKLVLLRIGTAIVTMTPKGIKRLK